MSLSPRPNPVPTSAWRRRLMLLVSGLGLLALLGVASVPGPVSRARPTAVLPVGVLAAPAAGAGSAALAASGSTPAASTNVERGSPTLERIRATSIIAIGYRQTSIPFSYLDARRRPVGYSIDICRRVVEAVRERLAAPDIEIREVAVTSANRLSMLANGSVDLECGVTTNTAERQKQVGFSVTTFVAASRLLVKRDSAVRALRDMRGGTVATTLGTTSMQYLTHVNETQGLELSILAGRDDIDSLRMLRNDQAEAFAMDDVLLRGLIATSTDGGDYRICDDALTVEPYAIGLPHGDPGFKQLVDEVITGMYRRGEMARLYQTWFQSPLAGGGYNLKMPAADWLARLQRRPTDSPDPQAYR